MNLYGSIIGGCEFGTFVSKSNNDRSDFYNISGHSDGVHVNQISATVTNCNFYNISNNSYGVHVTQTSATFTNCNFYNINGGIGGYGVHVNQTSATIENCIFSAIESDFSIYYTPYSSLIKILPPETTGCRFLPEGKAQSIFFDNDCVINGKKVSDLLNS